MPELRDMFFNALDRLTIYVVGEDKQSIAPGSRRRPIPFKTSSSPIALGSIAGPRRRHPRAVVNIRDENDDVDRSNTSARCSS